MSDEPLVIFVTGTAGAGKTSFVRAFAEWMRTSGYDAGVVNLDPGLDGDALEPDVDIRDWVRLADLQDEYGLGPNGAQVAAADLIALKVFEVKQALGELRADYVLVDTPGQIELFAFREASKAIVEALGGDRALLAFLFDPGLARNPSGFVSLRMLSATVEFRFRLPLVNVLSKSDALSPEQLGELVAWSEEPGRLQDAVQAEIPTPDVQLSTELFRAIEGLGPLAGVLPVSAKERTGLEPFYRECQRIASGGEDLERSQESAPE